MYLRHLSAGIELRSTGFWCAACFGFREVFLGILIASPTNSSWQLNVAQYFLWSLLETDQYFRALIIARIQFHFSRKLILAARSETKKKISKKYSKNLVSSEKILQWSILQMFRRKYPFHLATAIIQSKFFSHKKFSWQCK